MSIETGRHGGTFSSLPLHLSLCLCLLSVLVVSGVGVAAVDAQETDDTDTIEISEPRELQNISEDLDADYVLVEDINATGVRIEPAGGFGQPFNGSFDGDGHTISGLTLNAPDRDFASLLGIVGRNASVERLALEDVRIAGFQDVGAVAGVNRGRITQVHVDGEVRGDTSVGGIVGTNSESGSITASYSTARVRALGNSVGGLVGSSFGRVSRSYSTGVVTTEGGGVGGLVGVGVGSVNASYWDVEGSNISESDGGTGLTTSEMTGARATENMEGFDFDATWRTVADPDGYPTLRWQDRAEEDTDGDDGTGGNGSDGDGGQGEGMPGFGVVAALLALISLSAARSLRNG